MKLILISLLFTFNVKASLPPTQSRGANESGYGTTFKFNWGALPISRNGTEITFGTLPVSGGGTGLTSFSQYSLLSGSGTAVNEITSGASGTFLVATDDFPSYRFLENSDVVSALGYTPVQSGTVVYNINGNYPVVITGTSSSPIISLDYQPVASVTATSPIVVTGTASSPVLSLENSGVISGTYTKVGVNAFGLVTSGTLLVESDIPNLQTTKITSGTFGIAFGGTGLSTVGASSTVLTSNGSDLVYAPVTATAGPLDVSSTTVNTTLSITNDILLASGTITVTLPNAASQTGKVLTIKKNDATSGAVTIQTVSSQLIDSVSGSTSLVGYGESVELVSNGTGWFYKNSNDRLRTVSFSFAGNASGTVNCTTASCTTTSQSGGLDIVQWQSAGQVRYMFNQKTFKDHPKCVCRSSAVGIDVRSICGASDFNWIWVPQATYISNNYSVYQSVYRGSDSTLMNHVAAVICTGERW